MSPKKPDYLTGIDMNIFGTCGFKLGAVIGAILGIGAGVATNELSIAILTFFGTAAASGLLGIAGGYLYGMHPKNNPPDHVVDKAKDIFKNKSK